MLRFTTMQKRKAILVILDGLGDRANEELYYKTPLQYAKAQNLDRIARESIVGVRDPIAPRIRDGSDTLTDCPLSDNKRVSGFAMLRPNHSLSVVASDTLRTCLIFPKALPIYNE